MGMMVTKSETPNQCLNKNILTFSYENVSGPKKRYWKWNNFFFIWGHNLGGLVKNNSHLKSMKNMCGHCLPLKELNNALKISITKNLQQNHNCNIIFHDYLIFFVQIFCQHICSILKNLWPIYWCTVKTCLIKVNHDIIYMYKPHEFVKTIFNLKEKRTSIYKVKLPVRVSVNLIVRYKSIQSI